MSTPEPSGVDLARIALRAARQAAQKRGAEGPVARTVRRGRPAAARRDGRDPMAFGEAIARLLTERGWEEPAAAGSVTDQWDEIAGPKLAAHVMPVSYDQDSGCLTVAADSTAWATQARLGSAELIRRANELTGRQAIRKILVQQPGAGRRTAGRSPGPTAPEEAVRSRPAERPEPVGPPPMYLQARAGLRNRGPGPVPPGRIDPQPPRDSG
ncbi:DUF721 domain-containing protein [Streptomyces europaeiscabiei]|uniref:DUF721 domain-containing protein n=1 Tax=Streptomyces europaeiscabiei TaxID=146819 RepID=UPI0029B6A29D|nr:DUF721 domain-containing protein [Streptomyces europaeiscabiei]MDX3694842.1 DUF721 domain-containing protein [Streptomyces europaeiscabiei]